MLGQRGSSFSNGLDTSDSGRHQLLKHSAYMHWLEDYLEAILTNDAVSFLMILKRFDLPSSQRATLILQLMNLGVDWGNGLEEFG